MYFEYRLKPAEQAIWGLRVGPLKIIPLTHRLPVHPKLCGTHRFRNNMLCIYNIPIAAPFLGSLKAAHLYICNRIMLTETAWLITISMIYLRHVYKIVYSLKPPTRTQTVCTTSRNLIN